VSDDIVLMIILGLEFISSTIVKKELVFQGWPKRSETPNFLKCVLDSMTSNDLKRFLLFITEQDSISITGSTRPITVRYFPNGDTLPQSHVCFYQLDLPDYNDLDKLKQVCCLLVSKNNLSQKLLMAIHNATTFELS
jgi:hypothetical protein